MTQITQSTNADPAELQKFSELAHRWWDPNSEFKPLHDINPLRIAYIAKRVPVRGAKIIDIGCGGGLISEALATLGADVIGIDLSERALAVAKLHLKESGQQVDYRKIPAEEMAMQMPGAFDAVTCLEMLEHVPDPAQTIQACARLVKPGGPVFFSTINRNPKAYLFAVLGAEYILKMLPKGTHDYAKFIKPSELSRWCRQANLEVKEIVGMSYSPFSKEYGLGADTSVNYLVHAVRLA
jgi:2-polyprenyl-6-hydroxyphenyl methylase / 3-demethylubiquinone-9 3-methyltransferase